MSEPYPALAVTTENGRTAIATGELRPAPPDEIHERNGQPEGERKPATWDFAILALLAVALAGAAGAAWGGYKFYAPVVISAAVTLGIAAGTLAGVVLAQWKRSRPPLVGGHEAIAETVGIESPLPAATVEGGAEATAFAAPWRSFYGRVKSQAATYVNIVREKLKVVPLLPSVAIGTGLLGLIATGLVLRYEPFESWISMWSEIGCAAACWAAAGVTATGVRYLANADPEVLPEAPGLAKGSRVVAWVLALAGLSFGALWFGQYLLVRILNGVVLVINAGICIGLVRSGWDAQEGALVFPAEAGALRLLGARNNIAASILDSAEQQLGIDLRSTWALTVVRTSVEPLVICLFLAGWLSTSFTVVGLEEEGLNERFGVPVGTQALEPGLHVHLPWPIDRVLRVPVKRMQELNVGHEGEEQPGPENVLWAREHAANEYTLLLGDGRDLITIDAGVAYRIVDSRAWHYHIQDPADTLKAIAYRAVMRSTVNHTLQEALSENVAILTAGMRDMVQQDADALGLGIKVESFTVGGMHPPVPVAQAYQAVISAEVAKQTKIVQAEVFRNRTVPAAESQALKNQTQARADGAQALETAAGQAWSFRTLEAQFRSAPEEFRFRRRLETLEKGLLGRGYTVVDSRFQRDGGELWLRP